jgi:hypothetical protein
MVLAGEESFLNPLLPFKVGIKRLLDITVYLHEATCPAFRTFGPGRVLHEMLHFERQQ